MKKVAFIILHYKNYEVTKRCIESLLKYENTYIVVMDNGSCNGSGEKLDSDYGKMNNVKVIISKAQWGFSKGNNYAYDFLIKNHIKFDFVVFCNNDLIFNQNDFITQLYKSYDKDKVAVMGPDIVTFKDDSIHQNPLFERARSLEELEQHAKDIKNKIKHVNMICLKEKIKKYIKRKTKQTSSIAGFDYTKERKNVCLCGACLIFTPKYFENFNNEKGVFWPETNFYNEEEILYYKLLEKDECMKYVPLIKVIHDHSVSTFQKYKKLKSVLLFRYNNNLDSTNILINYIKNKET